MYEHDGDFGKVRPLGYLYTQKALDTLFCFASLGWHKCNDRYKISRETEMNSYLLLYTINGVGRLTIENQTYSLTANTIAVIPPHIPHAYYTAQNEIWEFYWIHPSGNPAEKLLSFQADNRYVYKDEEPSFLANRFEEILFLTNNDDETYVLLLSDNISSILHHTVLLCSEKKRINDASGLSRKIIQYIEKHYQEPNTVSSLCNQFYISQAHLMRIMKKDTGYTPHQYLMHYRILKSVQLLAYSNLSIAQIAYEVGFGQPSNFIKVFKQINGVTPMKARNGYT